MRISRKLSLIALFTTIIVGVGVSCASAEKLEPWWHLSSRSRPAYIQPAKVAVDEVQEITVSATKGMFYLEDYETGESDFLPPELPFDATDREVEQVLEGLYGAGNVEVGQGEGAGPTIVKYRITFKGNLSDRSVALIRALTQTEEQPLYCEILDICALEGGTLAHAIEVRQVEKGAYEGPEIVVIAANLGDANVDPATDPVTFTDKLPASLKPVRIEADGGESGLEYGEGNIPCSLTTMSCTFTGTAAGGLKELAPYDEFEIHIAVVSDGAKSGEVNEASVTGGGAPPASTKQPIVVDGSPIPYGASDYELRPEEVGGAVATQAGSHPFQLTTSLTFNETDGETYWEPTRSHAPFGTVFGKVPAVTKDLHFNLPPGLIGNPTPFPQCSIGNFLSPKTPECPADTIVGVARVAYDVPFGGISHFDSGSTTVPLVSLEPAYGEPARFGFMVPGTPVYLGTEVRTGSDYGVVVNVLNISETAELQETEVTFWGVPGDMRHNDSRDGLCLEASRGRKQTGGSLPVTCPEFSETQPPPLLSLPTSCTGPLKTTVETDSWQQAGVFQTVAENPYDNMLPALDGCNRLPFEPEVKVTPDVQEASKPSGLTADVHVPQAVDLDAEGLSASDVKTITVALPEGVALNPSAADGLASCSDAQIGFEGFKELNPSSEPGVKTAQFTPNEPTCPNASKIANVTIHSPLLPEPLVGFVYLASPQNFKAGLPENPFELLVAQYLVAKDPVAGVLVKLPLNVDLTASGQVIAMQSPPQLPFEDAALEFFGGERAPLVTPSRCGIYTTHASFAPWSGNAPVPSEGRFAITTGPEGGPCPGSPLPFHPSLASGTTNINAGSFSELTTTLSRPNGDQNLESVSLHYPPGISGLLSGVKLCAEAQANAGTCGPESDIGETIVSVGVGGEPFTVTGGKIYITEKYEGAPFGLSITNPAKAGPFDLQEGRPVVVRAKVEVNPITAALTVTINNRAQGYSIPTVIEGFALQIQHVNVLVNRPGFTFNPTSCDPMSVTGTINGVEGSSAAVSVPLQIANCATLKFEPKFAVSTSSKTSRANGASLNVKLSYPAGSLGKDANVAKVKVDLPKQLPSRLTTLQKACTNAQFETNPAGCPADSMVGHAKAVTPLIPVPLEGPAYFVSHGGAKFPELVIVLQGYGVTLDVHGETFINKAGITSSTFSTIPDAPVGSFELSLPEGKYSALAANGNLCNAKLVMPTAFVAQNGVEIHRNTPITTTGCPKKKTTKKTKPHKSKSSHKDKHK